MYAIFPELWVLQRFKAAKVTLSLTQVIGNCAIRWAMHDFLLVFYCNCVTVLQHFRDIIDYFPKFKEIA